MKKLFLSLFVLCLLFLGYGFGKAYYQAPESELISLTKSPLNAKEAQFISIELRAPWYISYKRAEFSSDSPIAYLEDSYQAQVKHYGNGLFLWQVSFQVQALQAESKAVKATLLSQSLIEQKAAQTLELKFKLNQQDFSEVQLAMTKPEKLAPLASFLAKKEIKKESNTLFIGIGILLFFILIIIILKRPKKATPAASLYQVALRQLETLDEQKFADQIEKLIDIITLCEQKPHQQKFLSWAEACRFMPENEQVLQELNQYSEELLPILKDALEQKEKSS